MKSYRVNETIRATPDAIWAILTDAPGYPEWDPGIVRVEGRIAPGESIKVISKLNPGRTFPVKVTEFVPSRKMTWTGGMPLGLFKGERTFTLDGRGETTEFAMEERFSGPLLPLIGRSMPDFTESFEQFGAGLRQRAESAS